MVHIWLMRASVPVSEMVLWDTDCSQENVSEWDHGNSFDVLDEVNGVKHNGKACEGSINN